MRRVALMALLFAQACSCGTKPKVNSTSGIVVLSVGGNDVTEADTSLSFGEACVANPDVPTTTKSFLIKNSGQNALKLSSITLTGANAASFTLAPQPLPGTVGASSQVEIDVTFAPTAAGNESASVVIDTDDPNKPEVNVRLTGVGSVKAALPTYATACDDATGQPNGNDTCGELDYPDTALGLVVTKPLHVKNNGCPPLMITDVSISTLFPLADGGLPFHVHGTPPSAANPITIATGETYDLQIDFAPGDAVNPSLGDMYVTTNGHPDVDQHAGFLPDSGLLPDGIFYVALNGNGTAPQVRLTPGACDYNQTDGGGVCQGTLSGTDVVGHFVLSNSGNASVQVASITVPADDAGTFTVNLPLTPPFTLDGTGGANATVPFSVTYHPFNGAVSEDLVVVTDIGSLSSHLSGGSPAVIVVPAFLSFNDGGFDPNDFTNPQDLIVTNGGASPLVITAPSIGQDDGDGGEMPCAFADGGGRFVLTGTAPQSSFPMTLAPSITSDWTFIHLRDARIGGEIECTLHIPSNDTGTPDAQVTLRAATFVNCNPFGTFTPTGSVTLFGSVDGGVSTLDANASFDTDDGTTPRCINGQSDGLQSFHWTLSIPPGTPHYGTHLDALVGTGVSCASSNDGGCVDLTVSAGSQNFPPYGDAARVNLVVDGSDPAANATIHLSVTDVTGRSNTSADALTVTPAP